MACSEPPSSPKKINVMVSPGKFQSLGKDQLPKAYTKRLSDMRRSVSKAVNQPMNTTSIGISKISVAVRLNLGFESGVISIDLLNAGIETVFTKNKNNSNL